MFTFDSEESRKKFMESGIKQSIGWIKLCEESVKYYQNMIKTYKDFLVKYPSRFAFEFGLEIYELGLTKEKKFLQQGRERLTKLLEEYCKRYGKKETMKLKVSNMGFKVVKKQIKD